jgi:hypothetical protein
VVKSAQHHSEMDDFREGVSIAQYPGVALTALIKRFRLTRNFSSPQVLPL